MDDFMARAIQMNQYDLARKYLEEVKETYSNYELWDNVLKVGDTFRKEFPKMQKVKITIERRL